MNRAFKIICSLILFITTNLSAQHARFPTEGIIEFERSTNMYALIQKSMEKNTNEFMQQAYEEMKKKMPQFSISKSQLYFSKEKTLFKPIENNDAPDSFFGGGISTTQINTIFIDLSIQQQITQKKLFEQTFLIKDSTRVTNWKITSETREIAGYACRRANALIMDSIYVVAFYTDEIPVSGGPESFNGLPGMILGIALPHQNVTWFAKSVIDKSIAPVTPPTKGKPMDTKGFIDTLSKLFNTGEKGIKQIIKNYML